jgi:hypothetical protein
VIEDLRIKLVLTPAPSPLPRRRGLRVAPQLSASILRLLLRRRILIPLPRCLLACILPVPHGQPGGDLREIDVLPLQYHDAHLALIPISLPAVQCDILPVHGVREMAARHLAKGLSLLGGVDPRKADFVLRTAVVENGDGVTIGYADNAAADSLAPASGASRTRRAVQRRRVCILSSSRFEPSRRRAEPSHRPARDELAAVRTSRRDRKIRY